MMQYNYVQKYYVLSVKRIQHFSLWVSLFFLYWLAVIICLYILVWAVPYYGRIYRAQLSPHLPPDPTVLLHYCWGSDVFCYWLGVFLLTGTTTYTFLEEYTAEHLTYILNLFLFLFNLCPSFVSWRHLITWKQCCKQAGYLLLLLATS